MRIRSQRRVGEEIVTGAVGSVATDGDGAASRSRTHPASWRGCCSTTDLGHGCARGREDLADKIMPPLRAAG